MASAGAFTDAPCLIRSKARAAANWEIFEHLCQNIRFRNLVVSLKPREDLWTVVARKMRAIRPNNTEELKATIKATCTSRASQQGLGLMGSLQRCITAVTHAGGAQTKCPCPFDSNISFCIVLFVLLDTVIWSFHQPSTIILKIRNKPLKHASVRV